MLSRHVTPLRALVLCLLATAGSARALEPGESAPPLSLGAAAGTQAVPVAGKLTYVDFWAS